MSQSTPDDEIKGSLDPPIPVPTHGPGGTFSVKVSTHINAPPSAVLAAVRDTTTWPKWNTFCPSATISPDSPSESKVLEVGSVVSIRVQMTGVLSDPSREQGVVVTCIDGGENGGSDGDGDGGRGQDGDQVWKGQSLRIAWKSTGYSNWQLRSERVMEFVDDGEGGTEYVCWETFGGVLARVVKATVGGQLVDRFKDYARDLKGFVETK